MRIRHKILVGVLVFLFVINFVYDTNTQSVFNPHNKTIVIDPGHGGRDCGKVGVNGVLEKDINLEISFYLKEYLEEAGYTVELTRNEDVGLYSEDARNKKQEDLYNRVLIIDKISPALAVSIHQNSFTDESCKGAQVFYYSGSSEGKIASQYIQDGLLEHADANNRRKIKENHGYYLLKSTKTPTIIVECGFLSNHEECQKLSSEDYQRKVAYGICQGIIECYKNN